MIPFGKQQELLRDLKPLFCCFRIEGCGAALLHWPHPKSRRYIVRFKHAVSMALLLPALGWTQNAAPERGAGGLGYREGAGEAGRAVDGGGEGLRV